MKFYILFFFMCLVYMSSIGQTSIINENFNSGLPLNWVIVNNDSLPINMNSAVSFVTDGFVLRENPDNLNVGDSLLMASSWHEVSGEADDFIILPQITLGSFGNYLYFDARSIDFTHPEGLEVIISLDGANISDFQSVEPVYSNLIMSPYWTTYRISLDSLSLQNQIIDIAFRHFGNDQYLLALDNIIVEKENTVSISEVSKTNIKIYPNPTTDLLYIDNFSVSNSYIIFDNIGKIVNKGTSNNILDVSYLDNGVYYIEINDLDKLMFVKN